MNYHQLVLIYLYTFVTDNRKMSFSLKPQLETLPFLCPPISRNSIDLGTTPKKIKKPKQD